MQPISPCGRSRVGISALCSVVFDWCLDDRIHPHEVGCIVIDEASPGTLAAWGYIFPVGLVLEPFSYGLDPSDRAGRDSRVSFEPDVVEMRL